MEGVSTDDNSVVGNKYKIKKEKENVVNEHYVQESYLSDFNQFFQFRVWYV